MSNAVTSLQGKSFKSLIEVQDAGLTGMITLRGDLSDANLAKAVKAATGAAMPKARGVAKAAKGQVAWMSPDELMLFVDYDTVDAIIAKLEKALKGSHFMAVNVSDARGVFVLKGKKIRDVLAKGTPADMDASTLGVGEIRRTRLGQLPVAFWFDSEAEARLVCFRSVAAHVFDWLDVAAHKGSDPAFH